MKLTNHFAISTILLTVLGASSIANAALVSRLGGLAYYDTVANLTWLADANTAGTQMNWADANAWAAGLNINGISGWRLADTLQPDVTCNLQLNGYSYGTNCTGSEMGNLFYNVLGGAAGVPLNVLHNVNYDLFNNIQIFPGNYWTATEYGPEPSNAIFFDMSIGNQHYAGKTNNIMFAWAVYSGDVGTSSVVPVPAAVWLFGSGLVGLIGFAKRKKI